MTEPRIKTSNSFKGIVMAKNQKPMPRSVDSNDSSKKKIPNNPIGPVPEYNHLGGYKPIKGGGFSNGKTPC